MKKESLKNILTSLIILTFAGIIIYFLTQNFKRNPQEEIVYNYTKSLGQEIFEHMQNANLSILQGPGGCRIQEECISFCNNSDSQKNCFEFAQKYALLTDAQLKNIGESVENIRFAVKNIPFEIAECFTEKLDIEIIKKIYSGVMTPGSEIADVVVFCFENYNMQKSSQQNDIGIIKKFNNFFNNLLNKI